MLHPGISKLVELAKAGNSQGFDAALLEMPVGIRRRLAKAGYDDDVWFIFNAQPGGTPAEVEELLKALEKFQ